MGTLDSSSNYQSSGMKMFSAYPCIGMEGTKPWSLFTSNLNQRIRHMRWRAKKKSTPSTSSCPSELGGSSSLVGSNAVTPKRRCLEDVSSVLPDDEYTTHLEELKKECDKDSSKQSEGHIKNLLKETFANRQL